MVAQHPQLRNLFLASVTALVLCLAFEFIFPGSVTQYQIPLAMLEWAVLVLGLLELPLEKSSNGPLKTPNKNRILVWGIALLGGVLAGIISRLAEQTVVVSVLAGVLTMVLILSSVELRLPAHRLVTPLVLLAVLSVFGAFYLQGYSHLPGDDGTPGMTYARWLAQEQQIDFQNPIYPELQSPAYESFIAAEFPLHTVLASAYQFAPDSVDVLRLSNLVILGAFLLSLFTLFLFLREVTGRDDWAIITMGVVGLLAFYGRAFWGGHFAQILGMVLLPLFLLLLHRYMQSGSWKRLVGVVVFLVALYPIHTLTWIVASSLTVVGVLLTFFSLKRGWWSWLALAVVVGGSFGLVWLIGTVDALQQALPTIAVETPYSQIPSFLKANVVVVLAVPLALLGGSVVILKKWWILAAWFLVTWFLTQASVLDVPFYAIRFDEYFIVPLGIVLSLGLLSIIQWTKKSWPSALVFALVAVLFIPSTLFRHTQIAQSYLTYSAPYHPSTIYHDDVVAFEWLRDNTPEDSLIIDVEKFGRFIPVISGRKRSMLGLEVYTAPTQEARHGAATALGADFIVWDAVLTQTAGTYAPYAQFTQEFFDQSLFKLVYENPSVNIYQVL